MIRKFCRFVRNYREMNEIIRRNNEEILSLKNTIEEKNRQFDNRISDNLNCIVNVESSLLKIYSVLEYKFWQNRSLENRIIYEQMLRNNEGNLKKDFNPLVSIIIPVFNGSNYMRYAIDSALNQTYKNLEIIVVNDGSTDDGKTEKIAKSYGDRIKYISKENGGVSSALNVGIKNMKGDYFAWLSHDDVLYKNHIEENIRFLQYCKDDKVIPYSCFDIIDSEGKVKIHDTISAGIHTSEYKLSLYTRYACILRGEVNGGNIIIPRNAFEECGYFEEGNRITQEKEMWSRLLKKYKFVNVPIITYSIRNHDKQVSSTSDNILVETRKKLIEIINNITENEMIAESGTVSQFYLDLYIHYNNNGLKELADEMYRRYEETLKSNSI